MNKFLAILISLLFLLGLFALPSFAYADSGTSVLLQKNQTVNHDYFATGNTVTLSGIVNGDAYVAGRTVIVDGIVNGDLLAAGGTVNIRGKVAQDIRVAGGQILVSGDVGRNITTLGGSVNIADSAKINGSLTAGTGELSVFAPIGKEANIGAGQVTLANTINGNVQAGVGQLTLAPNAKILGDLTYWSDTAAQTASQSQVMGNTIHKIPPQPVKEEVKKQEKSEPLKGLGFILSVGGLLSSLLVGFLLAFFMPVYTQNTATLLLQKPLQSLGLGFLSMIAAPFIFILLLVTLIGIPLDLILLAGFLIFIYLAKIIVGVAIGIKVFSLLKKKVALGWTFLVGMTIYYIVTMIPLLGFLMWMIGGLMGLGAIFLERKYVYTDLRKKHLI